MSVNLNRLREALDTSTLHPHNASVIIDDAAQAVLDAPTVWWCAVSRMERVIGWRTEVGAPEAEVCHDAPGCGLVALVPVVVS